MDDMDDLNKLMHTESAGTVQAVLDFWLNECALDQAPTAAEVGIWRDLLQQRGGAFIRLAQLCQSWLDEAAGSVHEPHE